LGLAWEPVLGQFSDTDGDAEQTLFFRLTLPLNVLAMRPLDIREKIKKYALVVERAASDLANRKDRGIQMAAL